MSKLASSLASASIAAFILAAGPAYAANAHSWVSTTGGGSACTRTAPCASFGDALNATVAGGVISVLDQGGSDGMGVALTKSITIRAEGVDSGVTSSPSPGATILINAGTSDVVTLEGLHLNGGGIQFTSGGQLHVVRCTITNENVGGNPASSFCRAAPAN